MPHTRARSPPPVVVWASARPHTPLATPGAPAGPRIPQIEAMAKTHNFLKFHQKNLEFLEILSDLFSGKLVF